MNFLMPIAVALGLAAAAELSGARGLGWPLAVLPLLALPHLLARRAGAALAAGDWTAGRRWDRAAGAAPLAVHALALFGLGWSSWLRERFGDSASVVEWPGLGLAAVLLPYLAAQAAAIDARARNVRLPVLERHRLRAFQWRMLAAGLAPLGLYLLFSMPVRHWEGLRVRVEEIGALGAAWSGLLLFGLVALLPQMLVYAWDTVPMPHGPRRSMLEGLARSAGFRHRDLLLWRTGGLVSNAAIVGFSRRQRVVLFTDALLADLQPRELAAVFCHEMGHSLRGHVWIFGAATLGLFLTADAGLGELQRLGAGPGASLETGLLVALVVGWALGFGWLSRRFELDADLTSLELTDDAPALVGALERVSGRAARHRDSWRHFSAAKRVLFLRAAAREAGVGRRLRAQLGGAVLLGHALLGLGLVGQAAAFARGWGEDRVAVDLRLGRYEGLDGALAGLSGADPELQRLVRAAATLEGGEGPEELVELALAAARSEDLDRARVLLELARVRGHGPAGAALGALAADPGAPVEADGLPRGWAEWLESPAPVQAPTKP